MRAVLDKILSHWPAGTRAPGASAPPASDGWMVAAVTLGWMLLVTAAVLGFMAAFAGVTSWAERRVAGRMMSRIGPNRVGPLGFLQWLADGVKCFLKEDVIPKDVDGPLFRMAPYFVFGGTFAAFAVLPFGVGLQAADLNVGIFYIAAVTSLVVVGLLMAGWSSNNKWSLLGGVRSAAQIVSYEIPSGLAVMTVVALSGTLRMQGIIEAQGGMPWNWYVFDNPFSFIAFFIFMIATLAEGNRTPFDLPEAESELVAGYNTEYSGMRFVMFFFGEWANLWVMCAVATTLFLGGWQVPGIDVGARFAASSGAAAGLWLLLSVAVFFFKTLAGVFLVIWLRWTLPRLRVDQLMTACWKYLVPAGFLCVVGASAWALLGDTGAALYFRWAVRLAMTALGAGLCGLMVWRAIWNIRTTKDDVYVKVWT